MVSSENRLRRTLSTYPFPLFFEEWGLDIRDVASAWDNKGDIVIGNDVWIGYEAILLANASPLGMEQNLPMISLSWLRG